MRDETEIEKAADRAADNACEPKYPGMTYEEGVRDALDWILGNNDADPTE